MLYIFKQALFVKTKQEDTGRSFRGARKASLAYGEAGVAQGRRDELGRLEKVIDALGGESAYTCDEVGNKISQIDPNGISQNGPMTT